jgi:hypothetical protein
MRAVRQAPSVRAVTIASAAALAASLSVPAGDAHVAQVQSQRGPSVPSVGPAEVVSSQPADSTNEDSITAQVVVGWGGQVTAVWFRDSRLRSNLFASVRGDDGVWSDPVQVSKPGVDNNDIWVDVAAGRGSHVSAVWRAKGSGGHQQVLEAHREGGGWSEPHRVGRADLGTRPDVAIDGRGETTVAWLHRGTRVASRSPDGAWSAVRRYVRPGGAFQVNVAANRSGDEVLMWDNIIAGTCICMWTAFKKRGATGWGRAVSVPGHEEGFYFDPALGVFASGRVLAAWSGARPDRLVWTRRSPAGHWARPQQVPGRIFGIDEDGGVVLGVGAKGRALAVLGARYSGTWVARYRVGRGFGKTVRLSKRRTSFEARGAPLMTADGTAVVAGQMFPDRVAYRWQAPGQDWSPLQRLDPTDEVASVAGRGTRMAVLFRKDGLRARIIDVNPPS